MRWLLLFAAVGCGDNLDGPGDGPPPPDVALDAPRCPGPDEDSDGWPDACDNCIAEPNPNQLDVGEINAGQAADGVGDACDPRPATAGDYLALVELHDSAGAYTLFGVTSLPGNGALRLGALDGAGSATFVSPATMSRIAFAYTVIAASDQVQWAGVWTNDSGPEALFFESAWDPVDPTAVFRIKELHTMGTDRYSPFATGPTTFTAGARYRVFADTERVTGGDHRMSVTDLATHTTQSTTLAVQIPRVARGYLEARYMIVDFDYMLVYAVQ